ncbi:DNA alkylation repair protein [Streptomyces longwoodensis]|uniref:DNA alkylation repair protein n=2 Tax=Streptomyces longwoodensis TaxID=68231 RepID=A0A101QTB0_9ACTN|nr:DNA alkylation repair protein [Streptomyces longwoodensis]
MMTGLSLSEVLGELRELEDPRIRAGNEKRGDGHAVNLSSLRAFAKQLGTQHELALDLWATGDSAAKLLSTLTCCPSAFKLGDLDAMLRSAQAPKVRDWLVNYVVKKSPHCEALRAAWLLDPDPVVASAGWMLTTTRVVKNPEGVDLAGLLDVIEAEMKSAPEPLQWAMNECLGNIGIKHPAHRSRAIGIGERLGVLKDYPTPPNCTSPFVPVWIAEMVGRKERRQGH